MTNKRKYPINKKGKKIKIEAEKKEKFSIKELKPFIRYYKPYKTLLISIILLMILSSIIAIALPIFTAKIMDNFVDFNAENVIKYAVIVLVLAIFDEIIFYLQHNKWNFYSSCAVLDLKTDIIKKLNMLNSSCFDNKGSSYFASRLSGDISTICGFPLQIISQISNIISNIGFVVFIFTINKFVALYVVVLILAQIFIEYARLKRYARRRLAWKKVDEEITNLQYENIRGMKDIKSLNSTDSVVEIIKDEIKLEEEYNLYISNQNRAFNSIIAVFKRFLTFAFYIVCVLLILDKQITLAVFMVVYNYKSKASSLAYHLIDLKSTVIDTASSAKRVNELFDAEKCPPEQFGNIELENAQGNIKFNNVTFAYNKEQPVLNNINFEIYSKTMVSIVGKSGVGKSTIASLLIKLYELEENNGEILIDSVNINNLTKNSIRDNICMISQTPYIFNMTVAENLRIAKNDATNEELFEVLKQAQLYDYIIKQPEQLETKLGENGLKLSGGQRQRMAIARALLKPCKVMIFDESTSALDNENQAKIKEVIKQLSKERTIIVIAHRLSTVIDSDNIIFIEDGKVSSQGTHRQLMENCEGYRKLYQAEE